MTIEHKDITGDDAVHPSAFVDSADPGAVGADKHWIDTTGGTGAWVHKVRNGADSGWETLAGGGGGGSFSYLGYDTVGGSTETMTTNRHYLKKITVASSGLILSVDAYLSNNGGDNVQAFGVSVYTDSAGVPSRLISYFGNPLLSVLLESTTATPVARWLSMPMAVRVTSGDYWIGVVNNATVGPGTIAYDVGTDKHYTPGGAWAADPGGGLYALTTSARQYSIRASFLTT